MKHLKILVVEDDPLIADDIAESLHEFGHSVCAVAYTGDEAIALAGRMAPDLTILDIQLGKGKDGVEVGAWLRRHAAIPIIYLTAYADERTLKRVMKNHPDQYLIKPFNPQQLKVAVEVAVSNYYSQTNNLHRQQKVIRFASQLANPLSERETDVLKCLAEGLNNHQIAEQLFISDNTVKTHLKNLFVKCGVQSRSELLSRLA